MAVDIKSLRIGSHVAICGGERVAVTAIRSNGIVTTTLGDMDESNLDPIQLTPELLKELGFEKGVSVAVGFDRWYDGWIRIENNVMQARNYWTYGQIKLHYLHELEDLYYLIYAEELINDRYGNSKRQSKAHHSRNGSTCNR